MHMHQSFRSSAITMHHSWNFKRIIHGTYFVPKRANNSRRQLYSSWNNRRQSKFITSSPPEVSTVIGQIYRDSLRDVSVHAGSCVAADFVFGTGLDTFSDYVIFSFSVLTITQSGIFLLQLEWTELVKRLTSSKDNTTA